MSTPPHISAALMAHRLTPFKPRLSWVQTPRVFLMTVHFASQLSEGLGGNGSHNIERWEKLEADISFFVEGGLVNRALMKQLEPKKYEHWNLRSVRPRPSIRVFGRFGSPDLFVGTHAINRPLLGGKWSQNWELEKLVCEDHWKDAVGDACPFRGVFYTDYITENASENIKVPL